MRLDYIRLRHLGPFADFSVDLTKLAGPLVAITGPNGAGKSTFLECAFGGSCYRETPTRGSLADLATARDALLESRIVYGAPFSVRHLVDAVSGKSEAVVFDAAGEPVLPDSKVRSFDTWASRVLPAPEVLYSAMFAPQGARGFLGMTKGDRKGVLLRVLGVERLELMAERARARVKDTKAAIDALDLRAGDVKAQLGIDRALGDYEAELEVACAAARESERALSAAREDLAAAEAELRRLELLELDRQATVERRTTLTTEQGRARAALSDLEGRLSNNRAVLAEAERINAAVARVAELRGAIAELERLEAARVAAVADAERISGELATERSKLTELEERIRNNRAVLADADAIRAAVARAAELREQIARLDHSVAQGRAEVGRFEAEQAGAEREAASATKRVSLARQRLGTADVPPLPEGILETARADVAALTESHAAAVAELDRVRGQRVAGAEERIGALRSGLESIALNAKGATKKARETLELDNAAAAAAAALPTSTDAAEYAVEAARKQKQNAEDALAEYERRAALQAGIEAARVDLATAEREASDAQAAAASAKTAKDLAEAEVEKRARDSGALAEELAGLAELLKKADPLSRAEARLAELEPQETAARAATKRLTEALGALPPPAEPNDAAVRAARAELSELEPTAAKASLLANAEVRLAELKPQEDKARAELARINADLGALPPPAEPTELPNLAPARERLQQAETADRTAHSGVAVAEQRLTTARALEARLEELRSERAKLDRDLADWNRLAADLGRDGLQAAEIDAAGPELTELVNDLLHQCVGPRFSVSIETTKASADGKRQLEGCEVRVIDTLRGREAEASTFSGGEKVILGEAMSLALSMLACRRAGLEGVTLVRDESGAALDPANARAYVAMLRRAAEIVRADRVLFVSHVPEIIELADDRIDIPAPAEARPSAAAAE